MIDATLERATAPLLHYNVEGHGPPVMLIHGVGANLSSWEDIVPALAEHFTVVRFDLRGHGRSGHIGGRCTLDDFVQDVVDVLTVCGITNAHIVGFSLGGLIAQCLAITHPEMVDRLVLLSAVAGRTPDEQARMRERVAVLREQGIEAISGPSQHRWFTPAFVARHPDLVRKRMEELHKNHRPSYLAAYTAFATSDLGDRLHMITHPTLIATGEHDAGSNPRMARFMHEQIRGARLHILRGLRHSVLVEAPEQVATLVLGFLRQVARE
jgi:(E)-2-((N-methylformamido)methylene)succinate hydrolase